MAANGYYALNADRIIPFTVRAVQELDQQVRILAEASGNAAITSTGDVSIFEDPNDPSGMAYEVKQGDTTITRNGVFSDVVTGVLKTGIVYSERVMVKGKDVMNIIDEKLADINTDAASSSGGLTIDLNGMTQELTDRILKAEELAAKAASETAFLRDILTNGGSVLGASTSASLSSSITSLDVADSAIIRNHLTVLGRATVNNLGVTGTLNAGFITINGIDSEINTVGEPLRIQSLARENVEFMNGKVVIETTGDVTVAGTVKAKKIDIAEDDPESRSVGVVTIPSGSTQIDIDTIALTTKSHIFVTPEKPLGIVAGTRKDTDTITVSLDRPLDEDLRIHWWIIN